MLPLSLWLLLPLWACGLKSPHSVSAQFSACCTDELLCGCPPKYEIPTRHLDMMDCFFARYFHSECVLYLLVPQLCSLSSCPPNVRKKFQYWHSLPDVVKLPQMTALHDLVDFISHACSNSWDLTSFLKHFNMVWT